MLRKLMVVMFALAITSCATPPQQDSAKPETVQCPEQRAQMCTREYRPVCATRDTGIRCVIAPCPSSEEKTYANACTACADAKVIAHRPGACKQVTDQKSR